MSEAKPKLKRKRRLLLLFLGVVLGATGALIYAGFLVLHRVPGGRDAVSFRRLLTAGEIRYTVPEEFLQRQVAAQFPITQGMEGMLKFALSDPRFVADADPTFLRVEVALEAQFGANADTHRGRAAVRTQVRFDRAKNTVMLSNVELTDFVFDGDAAAIAARLQPLLQAFVMTALKDYTVVKLPVEQGFWTRTGASLVRSVTIENHQVVVTAGL